MPFNNKIVSQHRILLRENELNDVHLKELKNTPQRSPVMTD